MKPKKVVIVALFTFSAILFNQLSALVNSGLGDFGLAASVVNVLHIVAAFGSVLGALYLIIEQVVWNIREFMGIARPRQRTHRVQSVVTRPVRPLHSVPLDEPFHSQPLEITREYRPFTDRTGRYPVSQVVQPVTDDKMSPFLKQRIISEQSTQIERLH